MFTSSFIASPPSAPPRDTEQSSNVSHLLTFPFKSVSISSVVVHCPSIVRNWRNHGRRRHWCSIKCLIWVCTVFNVAVSGYVLHSSRYSRDVETGSGSVPSKRWGLHSRVSPTMMPLAPVNSAFCNTSSQVRTLPLLTTGTPIPSTRVFTTDRSAAPCLRRRADGWRACNARKAAPDASRLVASASVDDAGLQSRNLAETGTLRDRDRDETMP